MAPPKYEVIENKSEYITAVEAKFCESARDGHLVIGVSGGSAVEVTAASLERLYKGGAVKKVDIFFCDERVVARDDPESIFGAYLKKSSQLSADFCTFHPVEVGLSDAVTVAQDYERRILQFFKNPTEVPAFDCLLLGMGDDGHTCSLFPGHGALNESSKLVMSVSDSPKPPPVRVTMTFPLLNGAHNVLFLVRGASKAPAIRALVKSEPNVEQMPAHRVQLKNQKVPIFLLDNAAASLL